MARIIKPLTDKTIKNAKAKEKKYKLSDGGGLFLQITPNGSKLWRLQYYFGDKRKEYAIGTLKDYSLSEAREERERLRKLVNQSIDINEEKKRLNEEKKEVAKQTKNTFYNISQKWLKDYTERKHLSENYSIRLGRALTNYIYPFIESMPIDRVTRKDIINILEEIKKTNGLHETANRVYTQLNSIFMYAVTYEYITTNIVRDIDKSIVIGARKKKHYPTFTKEQDIKGLLLSIDDYNGDYSTQMALKILPYVFLRSFNIRHAEWSEIDLKNKVWIIPAPKMKTKIEFVLPLPPQVIELIEELQQNRLSNKYLFPSSRDKDRPISDNTMISAIRRMGYSKDEFVPHGFRSMFSTVVNKKGNNEGDHYTKDVVEALLAHVEANKVRGAYNRSDNRGILEPMRELISWYADYLDEVKNG